MAGAGKYAEVMEENMPPSLRDLIYDAKAMGCEAALRKHNHNVEYLTDEKRSSYLDVISFRGDDRVLEIGSSMGQHSRLIAKRCGRLDAFEVVKDQVEFARLWCEQDGIKNVSFSVGGAGGLLPFRDGAFDIVIMNYVLEWSAGRADCDSGEFHASYLKEVSRVLKPNGRLFLSTKNRFGLRLLLGSVDEHLGIRFGSALPRWLARILAKNAKREFTLGHLHSRNAIEKLLFQAGFRELAPFLSFPDARKPDIILPFNDSGFADLKKLDRSRYSKKQKLYLLLPNGLKSQFATSHIYMASK